MGHQSEVEIPLSVVSASLHEVNQLSISDNRPHLWLLILPYGRTQIDCEKETTYINHIHEFANSLPDDSVLCIFTTPVDAANTWIQLADVLHFQLWVAVKLKESLIDNQGRLPEHHAALLIMTKYQTPLRHNKTRLAYTYCPACDKTTKDYGGKKHTYHEYGTLISDVWRDITFSPSDGNVDQIVDRLKDMFGLAPYNTLRVVDLTKVQSMQPKKAEIEQLRRDVPGYTFRESKLLNGDSLEILPSIESDSIDFCFADPPYNIDKKYDDWNDTQDIRDYFNWCDRWLEELVRVLKPGRTCAVLNIPQWAVRHFKYLKSHLTFQNWIAWEGLSLPVRQIMPAHYSILCCSKGPPRPLPGTKNDGRDIPLQTELTSLKEWYCLRATCIKQRQRVRMNDRENVTDLWWDIHRLKHNSRRVDHPCQLPPTLMRRLISLFTLEGESVLDPFNGAGTTSLCAEQLDRKFIGIELSRNYHELAVNRHKELRKGADPFAKVTRNLQSKNSRVRRIGGIEYKVPKKTLQLEVKRIAQQLGSLPTREDVERLSQYPIQYFDNYFINWGEVCAAARTTGMIESRNGNGEGYEKELLYAQSEMHFSQETEK